MAGKSSVRLPFGANGHSRSEDDLENDEANEEYEESWRDSQDEEEYSTCIL